MLAQCVDRRLPIADYLSPQHPVQTTIQQTLAELADVSPDSIDIAIDGCSVRRSALPLHRTALAFARLGRSRRAERAAPLGAAAHRFGHDGLPRDGRRDPAARYGRDAGGPRTHRRQSGAEGYYGIGLLGSPGLGVALKIEDGNEERGRNAVVTEVLRQLGALDDQALAALGRYAVGPTKNHRGLIVG